MATVGWALGCPGPPRRAVCWVDVGTGTCLSQMVTSAGARTSWQLAPGQLGVGAADTQLPRTVPWPDPGGTFSTSPVSDPSTAAKTLGYFQGHASSQGLCLVLGTAKTRPHSPGAGDTVSESWGQPGMLGHGAGVMGIVSQGYWELSAGMLGTFSQGSWGTVLGCWGHSAGDAGTQCWGDEESQPGALRTRCWDVGDTKPEVLGTISQGRWGYSAGVLGTVSCGSWEHIAGDSWRCWGQSAGGTRDLVLGY